MILKRLARYVHQMNYVIEGIADGNLVELHCAAPESVFDDICVTFDRIRAQDGFLPSQETNISFYTIHRINPASLPVDPFRQQALAAACVYVGMDSLTGVPKRQLWQTFVALIASVLGHQAIICPSEAGQDHDKRLFIHLTHGTPASWRQELDTLFAAFGIRSRPSVTPAAAQPVQAALLTAHRAMESFYLATEPEWLERFWRNLGDDLSRASLENFLRQRMWAKTFWDTDNYYTLNPPLENAEWRRERYQNLQKKPPCSLSSPSQTGRAFFMLHTFAWSQYCIPGLVEARPGNVVLDVGAGIGDTAVHFSHSMQNQGLIYAFEPLALNIDSLRLNLRQNNCRNVTIIQKAISDTTKELFFGFEEIESSTSVHALAEQDGGVAVPAISIDDFVRSHSIHVDFIKADIEGAELDLLRGAEQTLREQHPNCALALYHKQEDFRILPQFIASCSEKYTFYIRCDAEPMLFATCR